jgi:hypothetical protein
MNQNPCQEIPVYFDVDSPSTLSLVFPYVRSSASTQPDDSFLDENEEG